MPSFHISVFAVLQAIAGAVAFSGASVLWRRRKDAAPGAKALIGAFLTGGLWSCVGCLELTSDTLAAKVWYSKISYLGVSTAPLFLWLFIFAYTHDGEKPSRILRILFWTSATLTNLLVFTNDWHHLFWTRTWLDTSAGIPVGVYERGPGFFLNVVHCYVLVIWSAALLFRNLMVTHGVFRTQGWIILVAFSCPWFLSACYIFRVPIIGTVDNTPSGFVVTILLMSWNVLRMRLFDVVPFAHNTLFARIPDPVFVTDKNERLVQANPAAITCFDISDSYVGNPLSSILAKHPALISALSSFDSAKNAPVKDHDTWWSIEASIMTNAAGIMRGRLFILRDTTALQIAHLQANELAQKADRANRAKSVFLAQVSHDLRTPMHAILGMTELLSRSSSLSGTQRTDIDTIREAGESLLLFINDLLDLSRIEAGRIDLSNEPFLLDDVLDPVVELLGVIARRKHIEFVHWIEPGIDGSMRGDPNRLRQLLLNIAGNAIKFTDTGSVVIRARAQPGSPGIIRIEIEDTGPGIPEARLHSLFEPFNRGDPDLAKRVEGTGLGLAISHQIATAMKGHIEVSSHLGQGSCFVLLLPIIDGSMPSSFFSRIRSRCVPLRVAICIRPGIQQTALIQTLCNLGISPIRWDESDPIPQADVLFIEAARQQERSALEWARNGRKLIAISGPANATTENTVPLERTAIAAALLQETPDAALPISTASAAVKLKVLLADDSPLSARVSLALLEHCGCQAVAVGNGKAVIERLKREHFDLVILDGQMPLLNGWEAAEIINTPGSIPPPIPHVIALSADLSSEAKAVWEKAGIHTILPKPVRLSTFQTVLESLSGNSA